MGLTLSASGLHVRLKAAGPHSQQLRSLFNIEALNLSGGASLALYGPSGSGKTTLLNLLCGLQQLAGAKVIWRDTAAGSTQGPQDIMQLPGSSVDHWRLSHAGLVFQQFQLFAGMTALENVLTPYRFDHWRCPAPARLRAAALLDQFGVEAMAVIDRLSRGEQQRVAIARALVREPSVILADEPTASLDPVTGDRVMDILIDQCRQRHVTLIVSTHDASLAHRFDQSLTLHQGQLTRLPPA